MKKIKFRFFSVIVGLAVFAMFVSSCEHKTGQDLKVGNKGKTKIMNQKIYKHTNRLINEKSPYLLQHAHNPVDWYPWGEEAFEKARRENLPIFLSIGYSTCHWCHVMERESFENEAIAAIINRFFVPIKVDREERPDIDAVYMKICQAMTGSGGWPLTIIMTPDKKPFFSATYLPPDARRAGQYGIKGLSDLLPEISDVWKNRRNEIDNAAEQILKRVNPAQAQSGKLQSYESILDSAQRYLVSTFDSTHGGFGTGGPKFPTPHNFSFLLRCWKRNGDRKVLEAVELSLDKINRGGIHDHIGGGFARYSTDRAWLVPHFEKMLYDQALLSRAYLEAYQATGKESYKDAAIDIFEYVLRDMTSLEGAFFSAEDADSEGVEGKFYVWKESEIDDILSGRQRDVFKAYYGVSKKGNFEHGENILNIPVEEKAFLKARGMDKTTFRRELKQASEKIFNERETRVRPSRDDKILASWNGLMISSLALGSRVLDDRRYLEAAEKAASFISKKMISKGGLLRRYRDGEAAVPGYLDDYAFMASGFLDLYEASFDKKHFKKSISLADSMLENFADKNGGFLLASESHDRMITNIKDAYDGAEPSGNSVAAELLLRLGRYTENDDYTDATLRTFDSFAAELSAHPYAHTRMLCAIDFHVDLPSEIVFAGQDTDPGLKELINESNSIFIPNALRARSNGNGSDVENLIPWTNGKETINNKATVYVCKNRTCKFPTDSAATMKKLLAER